jgi:glutamine cyclotransferase
MRDALPTRERKGPALGILAAAFAFAGSAVFPFAGPGSASPAPVYEYDVIAVHPHDDAAFTQGLVYVEGGFLYEGTGLYGESSLRKVEIETGDVLKQFDLDPDYFGEGVAALRDTIYQLTWNSNVGFSYLEEEEFQPIETFPYEWSGWGLTHDGVHLIASDGSSTIRFLDPGTRELVSQIEVEDDGLPVANLNELEYIQGKIYSNIWNASDRIAVIDPSSGVVDAWLDLSGLRDSVSYDPEAEIMNGIAFDAADARLFVTGKLWPKLFQIDVATVTQPTGVEGDDFPSEATIALRSFPNPCGRLATVAFDSQGGEPVSVRLFDAGGRLVRRLFDGRPPAGEHSLPFRTAGLASGIYFVTLRSGGLVSSRRILIERR